MTRLQLPPDLRALYDSADTPEPPAGLEERIHEHLRSELGMPSEPARTHGATPATSAFGRWGLLAAAGTFAAGLASGVLLGTAPQPPLPPAPPPAQVVAPTLSAPEPALPLDAGAPERTPRPPRPPARGLLTEEQRLIETARSALLRRDGALARAPLADHALRFPNGQLAEEREALVIQSFIVDGNLEAASARFDAFKVRHPRSVFLGPLEPLFESGASEQR